MRVNGTRRQLALIALALGFFIVPLVLNGQSGRNSGGESTNSGPSGKPSIEDRSSDRNPIISKSTASGNGELIEGDVIRIDTSLVTVPVTVMDKNGNYVPNLMRGDSHVFDNGIEQTIAYFATTDQPYTVALIIEAIPPIFASKTLRMLQLYSSNNSDQRIA